MIRVERIYSASGDEKGMRILVERLWPRGFTKEKANLGMWMKNVAPTDALRKWFNHEPAKWEGFKRKYYEELDKNPDTEKLVEICKKNDVIFLFSSKEEKMNNAVALKEYIDHKIKK
ncbi:MAG: DUF488 family protein [Thermoplasmatales archaeon]|nr:DUF488 family protein [Thermoplasmatales archaeon]MCW6170037.1 DUF488 family protein [Thermoplasmatales archaeon]